MCKGEGYCLIKDGNLILAAIKQTIKQKSDVKSEEKKLWGI